MLCSIFHEKEAKWPLINEKTSIRRGLASTGNFVNEKNTVRRWICFLSGESSFMANRLSCLLGKIEQMNLQ